MWEEMEWNAIHCNLHFLHHWILAEFQSILQQFIFPDTLSFCLDVIDSISRYISYGGKILGSGCFWGTLPAVTLPFLPLDDLNELFLALDLTLDTDYNSDFWVYF